MSTTELLDAVLTANGVDVESLPDRLETTYLRAIYEANGGNPDELPDNLTTTLLGAIASVASGGGNTGGDDTGGGGSDLDALIDGSITEVTSNVETVVQYACYYGTFLTSVNLPNATTIGKESFKFCNKIETFLCPNVTKIDQQGLYSCGNITGLDFLHPVELGAQSLYGLLKIKFLILRSNENLSTLQNTNAFSTSNISSKVGYIYVPRDLVDSYKSATNWSTYASQFRALEDYTVDGTITGELDESKI